jgi:NADH dehydrogenase
VVAVVGAGFAGLEVVRGLRRSPLRTILVDRRNHHLFSPLLYQVASSLLEPSEIARPVRALIRNIRNADFRLAQVERVDFDARRLLTDRGPIAYDYLVLSAGSEDNYFGNPALAQAAFSLKDLGQALALRNQILTQFEAAAWEADAAERWRRLTFVIVGGGPTGVENAGALADLIALVLRRDFRSFDAREARIVLVEGGEHLLNGFAASLQAAALRSLRQKGVEVVLGANVVDVRDGRLLLAGGRQLEAGTIIWTAGVKAVEITASPPPAKGRQSRLAVDPTLRLAGRKEVFVAGDLAQFEQDGRPLLMMIPQAQQEGRYIARAIAGLLRGRQPEPFRFKDPGMMATIGRNSGVAEIGRIRLSGFLGWLLWLGFHLLKVVSFRSRAVVLLNWAVEYFFYDRPVRLIASAIEPRARPQTTAAERTLSRPAPK